MAQINRSDDATNLGPGQLGINQGDFREQQDAIGDSLRMLAGFAEVEPGAGTVNNPLNAPFVLYVNPYTGRDTFAFGSYAEADDDTADQELRRIESQRLECGYTEAAPFRTINRAVIEAGLITSKNYFDAVGQDLQRVCIVLAPGVYDVICSAGGAVDAFDPGVATDVNPDRAFLVRFNPTAGTAGIPPQGGGIILPRGVSMVSMDLRKTIIRPEAAWVQNLNNDEAAEDANHFYPNRRSIFNLTGETYVYGMTFMDADGVDTSHHLVHTFAFATAAALDQFYAKLTTCFSNLGAANVTNPIAEWTSEGTIVGPQPAPGTQTAATDTTNSASPYIYNVSIRSELGLCGVFANGTGVDGFRSMVIAQYTGVSLQTDYVLANRGTCWELYNEGTDTWGNITSFADYRNADPNNVRMNPNRLSFHIRAVNRAVIQEVSVFAIGQGVHHKVESGAEITVTNSNSNFGGCAAIAEGHWDVTLPQDNNFPVSRIKVPTDLTEKRNNVREYTLGTTVANQAVARTITLQEALTGDEDNRPDILDRDGFSLAPGSQIWIENPQGNDFTARLAATAWDESGNRAQITVANDFQTGSLAGAGGGANPAADGLQGRRVYVRRMIDTRSTDERTYALILDRPANARTPIRDYILQDQTASIAIPDLLAVQAPRRNTEVQGIDGVQIMLRQQCPAQTANPNLATAQGLRNYYRLGDTIRAQNKHWQATVAHYQTGNAPNFANFAQQNVHTQTDGNDHNPEDYFKNATPIITFDADLSTEINSRQAATAPLGIELDASEADSVWRAAGNWAIGTGANNARDRLRNEVQAQYRTATDYRGAHTSLTNANLWNQGNNAAVTALLPQTEADRLTNPPNALSVDFRRPSQIRLFGHAYEWAGYLNYTKALPQYQGELSRENKFTYYGTSKDGGRVYFSGFNEEGALVSPAGLTDITTGQTVAPEELDPIEPACEFFNCLGVNDLTVNGTITGGFATTATEGTVEIATLAELTNAINGGNPVSNSGATLVPDINDLDIVVQNLGLLQNVDRIFYVAAAAANVPDADLNADGAFLNDTRTAGERRNACVFSNLNAVFNGTSFGGSLGINNRDTVNGETIIIRLYTATTTANPVAYSGSTEIHFVSGKQDTGNANTHNANLSALHICPTMRFTGPSTLRFFNTNLRFTTQGVFHTGFGNIYLYGGQYELRNAAASAGFSYTFVSANANVYAFCANDALRSGSRNLALLSNISNGANFAHSGLIYGQDVVIDTNYTTGQAVPTITLASEVSGHQFATMFYSKNYFQMYLDDRPGGGLEAEVNWTISYTGTTAARFFHTPGGTPYPRAIDIRGGLNNVDTWTVTVSANVTSYQGVQSFNFTSAVIEEIGNANSFLRQLTTRIDNAGAGLTPTTAFNYVFGAACTVNNVFDADGQSMNANGTIAFVAPEELPEMATDSFA